MTVRRENLVGLVYLSIYLLIYLFIYLFIHSFIYLIYFATGIYENETEK